MKRFLLAICTFALISSNSFAQTKSDPFKWELGDNTTLKLGGFVRFCTSLDVNGSVEGNDFNPATIPYETPFSDESRLSLDPSATRFSLDFVQKTDNLGDIKIFVEADFRAASSTALRLRQAYINMCGVTAGFAWSFMSDLAANAPTVDIQGVSSRTFLRTPLVGYRYNFDENLSAGISLELPKFNFASSALTLNTVNQNIPDVPIYAQYKGDWGHIKASAVMTTMQYATVGATERSTKSGFGGQLSGSFKATDAITIYGQGIVGKGIGRYINALSSLPINIYPDDNLELATMPMYGASLGVNGNINKKLSLAASYSYHDFRTDDAILVNGINGCGDYLSATIFYKPAKRITLGAEFLNGTNTIASLDSGNASRVSLMIKYTL